MGRSRREYGRFRLRVNENSLGPMPMAEFVDAHMPLNFAVIKVAELVDENDEPEEQYADNGEQDALHHR